MPLRTVLRRLHLFLACTVGLIFVVSGVTGGIIVFDHALDERLNPRLLLAQNPQGAPRLSYQALLERAEAHYAGTPFYIHGLQAPRLQDSTQLFWVKSAETANMPLMELYLDPYTGEVLGERRFGEYFTSWVYMLHHTLLMGKSGKLLLGYSGIGMLLMLAIGLYLWWPLSGQWRSALTVRRGAGRTRRLLDLHRVAGVYGLVVLVVSVFSGLSIVFPDMYQRSVMLASPVSLPPQHTPVEPRKTQLITADDAIKIGTQALEGSAFSRLYFGSRPAEQTWLLTFAHPDDPKKSHGYERLTLNPYSGEVVQLRRWPLASGGDTFLGWLFPLHSGEALGLAGRWLMAFCGALPLLLMVTGIWRWRRKRVNRALLMESALAPAR